MNSGPLFAPGLYAKDLGLIHELGAENRSQARW